MNSRTKVRFITGSSRGLGRSLTEAVLTRGDLLAPTARKSEQLSELGHREVGSSGSHLPGGSHPNEGAGTDSKVVLQNPAHAQ